MGQLAYESISENRNNWLDITSEVDNYILHVEAKKHTYLIRRVNYVTLRTFMILSLYQNSTFT